MFESLNGKKYSIIYADPPWDYKGSINSSPKGDYTTSAADHYPTMTLGELSSMDIASIAEEDCLLFMWICSPLLKDALTLGHKWGFNYSTIAFVWHKQNTNMGHYSMSECEVCLVFKRKGGKIPDRVGGDRGVKQFVAALRGRHSEKPLEVRERIHRMFPNVNKIELFARGLKFFGSSLEDPNWDFWGNEI